MDGLAERVEILERELAGVKSALNLSIAQNKLQAQKLENLNQVLQQTMEAITGVLSLCPEVNEGVKILDSLTSATLPDGMTIQDSTI